MTKEVFKQIKDFPYYSISNYGNIYSTFSNKIKAFKHKPNGYVAVDLSRDGKHYIYHVHRLVATAFIPNPLNKSDVNHIDGNKKNNSADNLEWVTKSENMRHAVDTGLCSYSSRITKEHIADGLSKIMYNDYTIRMLSNELGYSSHRLKKLVDVYAKEVGIYEDYVTILKSKKSENLRIPIVKMDLSGNYLDIYKSISEASRIHNVSSGNIHNAISGKYRHTKGFTWRYATEEEIQQALSKL